MSNGIDAELYEDESTPDLSLRPAFVDQQPPPTAGFSTLLSTLNVATLFSLFLGICYFHDRAYRLAYYNSFGLNPSAIPTTFQDAIVDGFLGVTVHVLWLLLIVAILAVSYVMFAWFGARLIDIALLKLEIKPTPRSLHPTIIELQRNGGFRTSLAAFLLALLAVLFSTAALFLIGIPGDQAGRNDAEHVRASVSRGALACARYNLKGGSVIVGRTLGNTADRQFVLSVDGFVRSFRFEDLDALTQNLVRCVEPKLDKAEAGLPKLSAGSVAN